MRSRRNIILAPHIDDEVIGCFEYLEKKVITDVYYFYDLTPERKEEAENTSRLYEFNPHFADTYDSSLFSLSDLKSEDTIFAPAASDSHPQHKSINLRGRAIARNYDCNLIFYSVDMDVPYRHRVKDSEGKRDVLNQLYPSQAALLSDEKYSLFGGYTTDESFISQSASSLEQDKHLTIIARESFSLTDVDWSSIDSIDDAILKFYNPPNVKEIQFTNKGKTRIFYG